MIRTYGKATHLAWINGLFLCFIKQPFDPRLKTLGKKEKFKLTYSNKHENVLIDFRISERVFYPLGPICDAIYEIVHTAHWKCVCESNLQLLNSFIHQLQPSKRWLCKQSAEGMKGNNWQFNKQDNQPSQIQYSNNCKQMEHTTNIRI